MNKTDYIKIKEQFEKKNVIAEIIDYSCNDNGNGTCKFLYEEGYFEFDDKNNKFYFVKDKDKSHRYEYVPTEIDNDYKSFRECCGPIMTHFMIKEVC